jgi:ribosomal protein L11 methyltransferase
VTVPPQAAEDLVVAAVAALGTGCRQEEDAEGVTLTFWVPAHRTGRAAALLADVAPGMPVRVDAEDGAWRDAMRAFHRPIDVGGRLRVRPPWEEPVPGRLDVVVDPGMAFGTGQHDTTRGCLELLLEVPPQPLADVGCGSGVLAIAARRLGFDPVWACDLDPLAVEATLANARANGVALSVARREIGRDPLRPAPALVANITADVLVRLADVLAPAPPRFAVLSGLRPQEAGEVLARWECLGLRLRSRRDTAEWSALLVAA